MTNVQMITCPMLIAANSNWKSLLNKRDAWNIAICSFQVLLIYEKRLPDAVSCEQR